VVAARPSTPEPAYQPQSGCERRTSLLRRRDMMASENDNGQTGSAGIDEIDEIDDFALISQYAYNFGTFPYRFKVKEKNNKRQIIDFIDFIDLQRISRQV
jgi:hypothetical protein